MTGVLGGTVTGEPFRAMTEAIQFEPWYETERFEEGESSLGLVHHGERDPLGSAAWEGESRAGVVHGALVGREHTNTENLVERVLDSPHETLREVDGPFALACVDFDAERFVLATDKLGTRPCYYTLENGLAFGSSVAALLTGLDDPQLDEQGVSDLLMMSGLWGERTLVEGVRALAPASVLEYEDGEASIERYWKPDYESAPTDGYIDDLVDVFGAAMADAATTMDGDVGVWLSGGLDSRTLAAELAGHSDEFDSFRAYTYDANPRGGGNPELAADIADRLDMGFSEVEISPDRFVPILDDAIDRTDGMVGWATLLPLSATYNLPEANADVMLEGAGQGGLMGHHVRRRHIERCDSAVDSLYRSEAGASRERVRSLMTTDVDPLDSFRETVAGSDETQRKKVILDAHFANHYGRGEYASTRLAQTKTGVRAPIVHGDLIQHAARLPTTYRMGTIPLTNGYVPHGVTKPKLALTRAAGKGMGDVRYERTGVAPKHSYPVHVGGFVATTSLGRLRSSTTYGGQRLPDIWYRRHDSLRDRLDDLLAGACERSFLNGDEIRRLRREHLAGEANHMSGVLSPVTTLESWLRRHLDP
ncbi:asparagine synthase-related protein [Halococcus sediminicola]|uniref:asparagine synthase-related protein n=1 Tax=Halococcus sediminicola TaxID=1264579 RepID=UPI00067940EE|nr:asparagine synthase-related protein [Halococcus sediminicola]